jgi:peptidoglycan-associated lipoprotein
MKRISVLFLSCVMVMMTACCGHRASKVEGGSASSEGVIDPNIGSAVSPAMVSAQKDFEAVAGNKVHFGFDKYDLTKEAVSILERQADWLLRNNAFAIVLEGHCDTVGTVEYNLGLGERRATAVKTFLVGKGINQNRIATVSYGKQFPEFTDGAPNANSLNRRVVTVLTGQAEHPLQ